MTPAAARLHLLTDRQLTALQDRLLPRVGVGDPAADATEAAVRAEHRRRFCARTAPTLAAWSAAHGVLPTHPTTESGAVSVLCPPGTPARDALQWVLVVGNVGVVYHGPDEAAARRLWAEYQDYRPWGVDDVASLVLYRDGEPVDDRPGYPETWEADPEATWFGVGEDGEHHAGFYPDRDDAE